MKPRHYALIGKSGAGKSEVARLIAELAQARIVKTGAICREISLRLFGDDSKSHTQCLDDALTTIDSSIFLRAATRDADFSEALVIDALRFRSDFDFAAENNWVTVRVLAPDEVRIARLIQRGQKFDLLKDGRHRTEVELDDVEVDHELSNVGSIDDIRSHLAAIVKS